MSVLLTVLFSFCSAWSNEPIAADGFITRNGSKLYLNGQEWKFAGCNVYWMGLDENSEPTATAEGSDIAYPSHFRVDDAIATAVEMGANVIRSHTLGISTANSLSFEPALNTFDYGGAIDFIDYGIYAAKKAGIRLVIPLTDNWHYYHGGKHDFTDWRGISDETQFYYNTQVISDFKNYINNLLTHVNQYTGIALKDEPAIFAWETGNELDNPTTDWTNQIGNYIKTVIKAQQLVMDGRQEASEGVNSGVLALNGTDMTTDHFYPMNPSLLQSNAKAVTNGGKVYTVGEYQWNNGDLTSFLSAIESSPASGDLYWSLFPHGDYYGFEDHDDGCTLHYPGTTDKTMIQQLRTHAFKFRGLAVPPYATPATAPVITMIKSNNYLCWRGVAAAASYSVERSTQGTSGPWTVICDKCATDYNTPWQDNSKPSSPVWYRVRGWSLDGSSSGPYSNVFQA